MTGATRQAPAATRRQTWWGSTTHDHHLSHAYTAYCLSPYDTATVLVVNGGGNNNDTETYYAATPDGIDRLGGNPPTGPRAGGIGATYEAFTNWLGWHEQEASKTMAFASCGDPGLYLARRARKLRSRDRPAIARCSAA